MNLLPEQKIQALFFDFDGVLFDLEPLHFQAWLTVIEKLGMHDQKFSLSDVIGISDLTIADYFISRLSLSLSIDQLMENKNRSYDQIIENKLFDVKDLNTVLEQLSRMYKLLIVSSSSTMIIKKILMRHNLAHFFLDIIGSDKVTRHKPDPAPYEYALKQAGTKKKQAIAIEDSEAGLLSADRAGLSAIWFSLYQHLPPTNFQKRFTECNRYKKIIQIVNDIGNP